MNYQLIYTNSYIKKAKNFFKKHPELIKQYQKTLELLEINPNHPSLRLHKLQGRLSELSSVSINISYLIALEMVIQDHQIILIDIGNHDQVY